MWIDFDKDELPFDCFTSEITVGISLTAGSEAIVSSLLRAWATARNIELYIWKHFFKAYFQLMHDKQNEDKVKRTYELMQRKDQERNDNVD